MRGKRVSSSRKRGPAPDSIGGSDSRFRGNDGWVGLILVVTGFLVFSFSGCSWAWRSRKVTEMENDVMTLRARLEESEQARKELLNRADRLQGDLTRAQEARAQEIQRLTQEKEAAVRRTAQEKKKESEGLLEAQKRLMEGLKQELGDARAKLAMTERGLVLTFLDEIFFDSGKAVVKPEGMLTLEKVAQVLKETVPDSPVAVEGHTDNEPIKYSGWRSNWELSSGRALAVVHHFIGEQGVSPERLSAVGFGEHHPVASNDTADSRRQNRRVEVVILPKQLQKVKSE